MFFCLNTVDAVHVLCSRPLGIPASELEPSVEFFGGDARNIVTISLEQNRWRCVLQDEEEMDGSFLELVLKHIVLRAPRNVSSQYRIAGNWIGRNMQMRLNNRRVTWDSIVHWAVKAICGPEGSEDTLVAPFHDKDHWSIFVVEIDATYHLDSIPEWHQSQYARDFLFVVHLAWAQVKGYEPGSRAWREMVQRKAIRASCPETRGGWECGYAAVFRFWEYFLFRGSRIVSDNKVLTSASGWQKWTPKMFQRWFIQVLFTEIVFPGSNYLPPKIHQAKDVVDAAEAEKESPSTQVLEDGVDFHDRIECSSMPLSAILTEKSIGDIQVQTSKYIDVSKRAR